MKIVCISDTHLQIRKNWKVPDGDVLIHAGDFTSRGIRLQIQLAAAWFNSLPHKHKVYVPGNHDLLFQNDVEQANSLFNPSLNLHNSCPISIKKIFFWGTSWQPEFMDWAFGLPRGQILKSQMEKCPKDIDVIVSHSPPYGYGDLLAPQYVREGEDPHVGSKELLEVILDRKPKLVVCGHIHGGYGKYQIGDTLVVNASSCNEKYQCVNQPIEVEL